MFVTEFVDDRYRAAIYGAAIGDALGVPWEFCGRDACRCTGMSSGGAHRQKAGTWSDDTALLLATAASLKENGGDIDVADMSGRFASWMREGAYAIDHNVFDIGNTTARALSSGKGLDGERDNGNGSLMRILPLAFTDAGEEEIWKVSAITHAHAISCMACTTYVGIARDLMSGMDVEDAICRNIPDHDAFARLEYLADLAEDDISSGGYAVSTLEAALWCLLNSGGYAECVLRAVNLGADADTTACVAGGLAGIVYGWESLPGEWLDALRGKGIIEQCL